MQVLTVGDGVLCGDNRRTVRQLEDSETVGAKGSKSVREGGRKAGICGRRNID